MVKKKLIAAVIMLPILFSLWLYYESTQDISVTGVVPKTIRGNENFLQRAQHDRRKIILTRWNPNIKVKLFKSVNSRPSSRPLRVYITVLGVGVLRLRSFCVLCDPASASGGAIMLWYQGDDEDEEELMCSPALLARRASESWIDTPPVEVRYSLV